ncbi:DUF6907 domain-containing protein [Nocardioides humi]|uniref:Uncharacterized protein n=1 Tax=Nocardioides humi TaxID=449461 RepID=A0ABN2AWR2_9ACTN|nr:hypothetical protein [Nocardioides humi]
MDHRRPTWLLEPCPAWCTREHVEDDHPEDRYHSSEASVVPAIATDEDRLPPSASADAVELIVGMTRPVGELIEWVTIEPSLSRQPRLTLTRESAQRLLDALAEQLALTAR